MLFLWRDEGSHAEMGNTWEDGESNWQISLITDVNFLHRLIMSLIRTGHTHSITDVSKFYMCICMCIYIHTPTHTHTLDHKLP